MNLPICPAIPPSKVGAAHKKNVEQWLAALFEEQHLVEAPKLARQVVLLLDGSFAAVLLPSRSHLYGNGRRSGRSLGGCSRQGQMIRLP